MLYDFNSKKYFILLMLICFIFTILIIKAFSYLPPKEELNNYNNVEENVVTPATTEVETDINVAENTENVVKHVPEQKHGVLYKSEDSISEEQKFEEIDAPQGVFEEQVFQTDHSSENSQLSNEDLAIKSIVNAKKFADSGNYAAAINEYQKVAEYTTDKEISAQCYEGIADLYAKQKKYPTALSFAGKAYNSSPSIAREVLIAKIYYSAGKTDIAIRRINNLLNRGFEN